MTASVRMSGASVRVAWGNRVRSKRMIPYVPNLASTLERITEPPAGASV